MIQVLARSLRCSMSKRLAPLGLKLDHFALLMTLAEGENLTQTELGQRTGQANYAVTRRLDILADMGLVERRIDASSRRSHRVFLTEKGRALMPELFEITSEVNAGLMQPLAAPEREAFQAALRRILG